MMSDRAYQWFWRPVVRALTFILNFVRVEGRENIPDRSDILICSNHRAITDPFCIGAQMTKLPYFMAKDEIFHVPVIGRLALYAHAFPVKRGERDIASVQQAVAHVRNHEGLLVFPEGTRSKKGEPLPPKTGVALIAAKTGCDVLPVAVCFNGGYCVFKPITIKFGKLIPNEELHLDEGKRSLAYANASNLIMERIVEMLPPVKGKKIKLTRLERKAGRLSRHTHDKQSPDPEGTSSNGEQEK